MIKFYTLFNKQILKIGYKGGCLFYLFHYGKPYFCITSFSKRGTV